MSNEIRLSEFKALGLRILSLIEPDSLEQLTSEVSLLEERASEPNFWHNRREAESLLSELSSKRRFLNEIRSIQCNLRDLKLLWRLAQEDQDGSMLDTIAGEFETLKKRFSELEVNRMLSGEFDSKSAVMVIRSGAGGDDATDFAEMLMRMYLRYAARAEMRTQVLDVSYAEGAGIKSASLKFDGEAAYGKLSVEAGTHRLVRISPFNSGGKRQTSFAAVEVAPLIETTEEFEIPEHDIRIDVYRSSGPGGQSVNTTDSAVRVTHLPTGIVASCQNEKSQLQNKLEAMRVLQSRLLEMKRLEDEAEKKRLTGDVKASWGEQMRSYVLTPYQMVKDLRTLHEESNPDLVFDGKLDDFISAGIKWRSHQIT